MLPRVLRTFHPIMSLHKKTQKSKLHEDVALKIAEVERILRDYIRQMDSDDSDRSDDDNIEEPIHKYDF